MWVPLPLSCPVPVPIHLQATSPWHQHLLPFDLCYRFSAWRPYWFSGVFDRDVSSEVDILPVCSVLHIGNVYQGATPRIAPGNDTPRCFLSIPPYIFHTRCRPLDHYTAVAAAGARRWFSGWSAFGSFYIVRQTSVTTPGAFSRQLLGKKAKPANRCITFVAASCQLGFFTRTGADIQWSAARTVAKDKDGVAVLLSESSSVLVPAAIIFAVAWFSHAWLYEVSGNILRALAALWRASESPRLVFAVGRKMSLTHLRSMEPGRRSHPIERTSRWRRH